MAREQLLDLRLRPRADDAAHHRSALEEEQRRDGGDAVALRDRLVLVDVELADLDPAMPLGGDPLHRRGERAARAAPGGVPIAEHRALSLADLSLHLPVRQTLRLLPPPSRPPPS